MTMNIQKWLLLSFLAILLYQPSLLAQKLDRVQGEILVMFDQKANVQAWAEELQSYKGRKTGLRLKEQISIPLNIWSVTYDYTQISGYRLLAHTQEQKGVLAAQFNHYTEYRNQPNDPEYARQWPFLNTGQTSGTPGTDLDIEAAWNVTTGGLTPTGDTIVICVIDDGLDPSHQDFGDNLWINYAEIPNNGIDDDNNGFVDDYRGWNAFFDNDDIDDINVHGTPVTGLIGAQGNNGLGIAGVNWNVKLMIVAGGANRESENIQAYSYALTHRQRYNQTAGQEGAFVVATNFSQGVPIPDDVDEAFPLWCAILDSLGEAGVLNVASAPNEEIDVDIAKDYPADCNSDFLITVTSVDANGQYAGRGFGSQTIDIASFGEAVWTTTNLNSYGPETGTSFAAPLVVGAIGLLYSSPCLSLQAISDSDPASAARLVKDYLFQGVIKDPSLNGKIFTEGWLNINNSIQLYLNACSDCTPPTGLIAENITDTEALLNWNINDSITRVDLRWRAVGADSWMEVLDTTSGFVLKNLLACTSYEIQLRAFCGASDLGYGGSYFFKTDGCCEPPFDVEPILMSEDRALLAWTPLLAAQSYNVRYRALGDETWQQNTTPTASLFILGLQNCTQYEAQVQTQCEGALTEFSTSFFFETTGCGACRDNDYCVVRNANNEGEWIETFQLGDFSNQSGKDANSYADYTDLAGPVLAIDSTYGLLLIPGFDPRPFSEYFRIWIDYNQDGTFSSSELAFDPGSAVRDSLTGSIVIPSDALTGNTRMRVMMNFNVAGSACQLSGNGNSVPGEVEDYCVTIVEELIPCCAPSGVDTLSTGSDYLEIGWTGEDCGTTAHIVRYREVGEEEWLNDITQGNSITLSVLADCTAYEVQVQGLCEAASSDFTDTYVFATDCLTNTDDLQPDPFQLKVFPNPANDFLNVSIRLDRNQTLRYRLLTINGQALFQQSRSLLEGPQQFRIELNELPKGIYFLQLESEIGVVVKKLLVQ
jgi:serine protease